MKSMFSNKELWSLLEYGCLQSHVSDNEKVRTIKKFVEEFWAAFVCADLNQLEIKSEGFFQPTSKLFLHRVWFLTRFSPFLRSQKFRRDPVIHSCAYTLEEWVCVWFCVLRFVFGDVFICLIFFRILLIILDHLLFTCTLLRLLLKELILIALDHWKTWQET